MRNAETVLNIIRERGQRDLPVERVYRLLYQPEMYLRAYAKLYKNAGAMTPGLDEETVDGMSLEKIHTLIEQLRDEKYHWTPVRRIYIPKKNSKLRPLGLPDWSDKLLQEVIRCILEAYYESQFSELSHGFRPQRGCHTALRTILIKGRGTKWFIEGDIRSCFDKINHSILLKILGEKIHDNRFLRLIEEALKAGYWEDWRYHNTYSGVPQGSIVGPIFSNLVLDRLDKFVENTLIPTFNRGKKRKTHSPYVANTIAASEARKRGDRETARHYNLIAQQMPSRDPNDPNYRRLWYVRYADDWLAGVIGTKAEAYELKQKIANFLRDELDLELSEAKTVITHARSEKAKFLGYEIHTLHANTKHDWRGQRCINGGIGLRIPEETINQYRSEYMQFGKPIYRIERINDDPYSIVAQYQAEYRGIVQYYRMAYNLHRLGRLKGVMYRSLLKTLAKKFNTTCRKIYRRYGTTIETEDGVYKVLQVTHQRDGKEPLITHFGAIPLQWNKWVSLDDNKQHSRIWSGRSELIQRLLAQECEICGATDQIEVHHIRKLADLKRYNGKEPPKWTIRMAARQRKTLVVCQQCHQNIQYGRYDGKALA